MENFKKKSLLEISKMNQKELEDYYRMEREYDYNHGVPLKHIILRNKIHKLLLLSVKADRKMNNHKIIVLHDERVKTKKPVIYAVTHIGGKDIERTFEVIKNPCYIMFGDPGEVYKDPIGLLLFLNGTINLETRDKTDRKIAKERAIELLKNRGNLLIFPEGAWNVTDNLPVMKIFNGTVDIALQTGAEIIPIAVEQYENRFYFNIGKNISYEGRINPDKDNLTKELRNTLATLKWEIWRFFMPEKRQNIDDKYKENFAQSIVDKCDLGYTLKDVYETRYHDKMPTEDEVFEFEKHLIPSRENAFLLKKRK